MTGKLAAWPEDEKKTEGRLLEEHRYTSEGYLRFIAWWIGISMTLILTGGGFFITKMWSKVESIETSLFDIRKSGEKTSRRIAFVEIVNREIAEKQGISIKTLESLRELQESKHPN
jgi:hypothetical protein